MDVGTKEKWLTALRSGEYKQARGVMFNNEGYCCLGVLCQISGFVKKGSETFLNAEGNEMDSEFYTAELNYFGISRGQQDRLIAMNDEQFCDFSAIANYIEQELQPRESEQ